MRLFQTLSVAVILFSCDFSQPHQNDLVDLNKPTVLFTAFKSVPSIEILPSRDDVTNQVSWAFSDTFFEITLESTITESYSLPAGSTTPVYGGLHKVYDLFLESSDFISFRNLDSLSSSIDINIINHSFLDVYTVGNFYYEVENVLNAQVIEMQFKQFGEDSYTTIGDINELLNVDVNFKVRLFLRLSSGINLNTRTNYIFNDVLVTVDDFVPNKAIYQINFSINGFYL